MKVQAAALTFLALLSFAQAQQPPASTPPPVSVTPGTQTEAIKRPAVPPSDPADLGEKLLKVRRIHVESFGDDAISKQIQAMVIASLAESKKFVITEKPDRADATLKGSAVERTSQELHAYGESTAVGGAAGGHSGSVSGSWVGGTGSVHGSSSGGFISRAASMEDSAAHTETSDNARIAVRLVDADGDVIWATTQESRGAKYKGASADIADKVVKQLLRELEKLQKPKASPPPPSATHSATPSSR